MLNDIATWAYANPVASLLIAIGAIVIIGSACKRPENALTSFWPWTRRIVEAFTQVLLYLGLLWVFHVMLRSNYETFQLTHNDLTESNRRDAQAIWGGSLLQEELTVHHSAETVKQVEIPRENPAAPPRYRTVRERQPVPQNSIIGFDGQVDVKLSETDRRAKGDVLYNGYNVNAWYRYNVINDSDLETEAEFRFPLCSQQALYEDFGVTVDGHDVSPQVRFGADLVSWNSAMKPQQQSEVVVTYATKGMESYYYHVPVQREIRGFALTLTVDTTAFYIMVEPQTDLTSPEHGIADSQNEAVLLWKLDRAVMAPKLGIALVQPERPYAPYAKVTHVLRYGPHTLVLMGATLVLTLFIQGEPVRFPVLALTFAACCVQFLVIAGVSDYLALWGSVALGASLTGLFAFLLFRDRPTLLRILVYILVGFFAVVYPLAGLFDKATQRNSFDTIVEVGLIVYLFGLCLYARVSRAKSLKC
jgi:hypothetical protein